MAEANQAEHEQISTALDVEKLDENLFRSKSLWVPRRARGVFGGQVISQALVSATNCVDPAFGLHSLHCYFLSSASPVVPILYHVDPLRHGRSYSTFAVKAKQKGKTIFIMMCSFHIPEPWHPSYQWPMPVDVPNPEECELHEVGISRLAVREDVIRQGMSQLCLDFAKERSRSPIAVKLAKQIPASANGEEVHMYWMKAKDIPKYDAPFQKCILGYLSDLYFIYTGARIAGLKRYGKGPDALGMTSTLDHSIFFYDDKFDCADWLLYVVVSPRVNSGRGVMHGRMYARNGTLVAVTTQEGVIRAAVKAPDSSRLESKL